MIETQANIEMAACVWSWSGPGKQFTVEQLARRINKPVALVAEYWRWWQDAIDAGRVDPATCVPGGEVNLPLPTINDDDNTQHRISR